MRLNYRLRVCCGARAGASPATTFVLVYEFVAVQGQGQALRLQLIHAFYLFSQCGEVVIGPINTHGGE